MSEALSTTVPIIKIQRYFTTVDMERFTGLNIRSFSLIKFFAENFHSALATSVHYLQLKIHVKTFVVSSKP